MHAMGAPNPKQKGGERDREGERDRHCCQSSVLDIQRQKLTDKNLRARNDKA